MNRKYLSSLVLIYAFGTIYSYPAIAQEVPHAVSDEMQVTATVLLSDVWADALKNNTDAGIDEIGSLSAPSKIWIQVKGINDEKMKNEKVIAEIKVNGTTVKKINEKTDLDGNAKLTYLPNQRGIYSVEFTITTYDRPVKIRKNLFYFII